MTSTTTAPTKRTSTANIIASTMGWDISEPADYRYQPTRTRQAIYAVGNRYLAVGKREPKDDVGGPWQRHTDQFFAERAGTVLWVSEMTTAKNK